jgi:hypothetical protein
LKQRLSVDAEFDSREATAGLFQFLSGLPHLNTRLTMTGSRSNGSVSRMLLATIDKNT